MLRLDAPKPARLCDGLTRRDFLHAGAITTLGLTLGDYLSLAGRASDGQGEPSLARPANNDVNCIMLFLVGEIGRASCRERV